jgi:hypothetical protein
MASKIWFKQPKDITQGDILFKYDSTYRVRGVNNRKKRNFFKKLDAVAIILKHRLRIRKR